MKKQWYYLLIFFSYLMGTSSFLSTGLEPWTWLYSKVFSEKQRKKNHNKVTLMFSKYDTPHFTQLVFSWNAIRPKYGYFTFYAQVRDAKTGQWYDWHKMVEWGAQVQRSFKHISLGTTYHHVRLELPPNRFADALRIKIETHDDAQLSDLHALFVSVSDLTNFKSETLDQTLLFNLPSICLIGVPIQSQMMLNHHKKEALCSTTSSAMLCSYLMGKHIDAIAFARKAHDDGLDAYGSWPFNVATAFEYCADRFFFRVQRLSSFTELYKLLRQKIPVVVSVRGTIDGGAKEYDKGHLLIVIGWDNENKQVICHDPAFKTNNKVRVAYPLRSFLTAWERSRRLAYCASSVPS